MAKFNSICTHCGMPCTDSHRDSLMVFFKFCTYSVILILSGVLIFASGIIVPVNAFGGLVFSLLILRATTNYDRCPSCHALGLIPIYSPTGRSLWDKHQAWIALVTAEAETKAKPADSAEK